MSPFTVSITPHAVKTNGHPNLNTVFELPATVFYLHCTVRVFSNIAAIRLRGLLKWTNHERRRRFVNQLTPIGENPFGICVTYRSTVGLSDTDYNGHLSNSAYAKNLDYARMRAAVAFFPPILEAKGWLGLGSSHFHFVKVGPCHSATPFLRPLI